MPLTEDFTYQLGDTGFTLNTSSDSLPFVDITKVSGLDNAPYRETERDHEGADGGFLDAEFEKGRPITLDGLLYADPATLESTLDMLKANYAPASVRQPFYFKKPGVLERVLFVKSRGVKFDSDSFRRVGTVSVQFGLFAEDSRIYDAQERVITLEQSTDTTTGRGYSMGYPYGYGAAITPTSENAINSGNRSTPATIVFYGPTTSPELVNDSTGKSLKVNLTLGASDYIVIDLQYHTVLLNGSANRRGFLDAPNWFFLQPGDNFLRYRTGAAGTSTATVTYRNAWR